MILKKYKVPRISIPFILKKGELSKSNLFLIRHIKNDENFPRFRVIISKKLEAKAVKRNKLRRQIYESIRENLNQSNINTDFILIPKKKITNSSYQVISKDIKENIINNHYGSSK